MSQTPAFIIAPGSFAKPALYSQLENEIRSRGHEVYVVALPSVDDASGRPAATMEQDAAHIRRIILSYLDHAFHPQDVVLITHSYGGIPGNCALEGLGRADRLQHDKNTAVTGLISMASHLPLEGESIRSIYATYNIDLPEPLKFGVPGDYMPVNHQVIAGAVFNDVSDPDFVQELASQFAAHSSDSYDGKVTYEAWKAVPTLAIIPDTDLLMPFALQNGMFERAATAGEVKKVVIKGAGHGVNISRTQEVLEEIFNFSC